MTESSATPLVLIARRLVSALDCRREDEYRVAVLKRVARELGEDAYPAFIKILTLVEESDDRTAKRLLAGTLGSALKRFDLPSGRLTSWGATRLPESREPVSASTISAYFFQGAPERWLGPIEFLTVWYCQRTQRATLNGEIYAETLSKLIALMNHSLDASTLYPQKLQAHAMNELEGAYTRTAAEQLSNIAAAWMANEPPQAVARAAIETRGTQSSREAAVWLVRDL